MTQALTVNCQLQMPEYLLKNIISGINRELFVAILEKGPTNQLCDYCHNRTTNNTVIIREPDAVHSCENCTDCCIEFEEIETMGTYSCYWCHNAAIYNAMICRTMYFCDNCHKNHLNSMFDNNKS